MSKDVDYKKANKTHQIDSVRQKKSFRRKIVYALITLIIIGVFGALCYIYLFKISNIEYIGNSHYSTQELSEKFGLENGDRLFSYSRKKKEEFMLSSFPYLAECEIKRTVPDKITVTVVEREAKMYTYEAGRYVMFDDEMHVVEMRDTKPENLVCVNFEKDIIVKCILGEEIIFNDKKTGVGVKRVYDALSDSALKEKIKSVTLQSRFDYYLDYDGIYQVYLGESKDVPAKLLFLGGIVENLEEGVKGNIDVSNPKEGFFKETE